MTQELMNLPLCFSSSYIEARNKFREACDRAGVSVDVRTNPNGFTPEGFSLTTDIARFGDENASRLLVAICGTHGQEAGPGAATMLQWILTEQYKCLPEDTAVLFIHGNNPYGWAHCSRANENNVDLNRNCFEHDGHYPDNLHYLAQHELLASEVMNEDVLSKIFNDLYQYQNIHGESAKSALIHGQYHRADGICYGGREAEWSTKALFDIVETIICNAEKVVFIDWHTGLGKFGEPFFICHSKPGSNAYGRACQLWGEHQIAKNNLFDHMQSIPSYRGVIVEELAILLAGRGIEVTKAVIEFGTYGNTSVIEALVMDNWLRFHCSNKSSEEAIIVRTKMMERLYPSQPEWRISILHHAAQIYRKTIEGLCA